MSKLICFLSYLGLNSWLSLSYPTSKCLYAPCKVYGNIYLVSKADDATYRVYVEDNEYSADIVVFTENNQLLATQTGKWFFVKYIHLADYTIYLTKDRSEANFTVFFTNIDDLARCNR